MFSKILSTAVVVLATSGLASAQTSSLCNPVKGDKCAADPAVGGTVEIDFTQGASDFFTLAEGTTLTYDDSLGAVFKISSEGQAPTITSKEYIFFGKVDVWVQASGGVGVVTSFVLQSDDLDEIDWEWLGGDTTQVQTNYFSKGDTTTYDRGGYSSVSSPQTAVHKYTIDWTSTQLQWLIDDVVVRTLTYDAAKSGTTYPQTPMQIKLGTWVAGGKDAPEGTVQWAGGYTDFSQAPFIGYYQKLSVTDYSNGKTGATSYEYSGTSGTFDSIIVNTDGSKDTATASSSAAGSKTSSKAASSKTSSSSSAATTLTTVTSSSSSTATSGSSQASGTGSSPVSSATVSAGIAAVSSTPNTDASNAPAKAGSGKVVLTVGNVVVMGAAVFFGSLFL
ncbi:extracellular cell wall glucanase [Coniochaeta ligniaria NRRL 30616]|uniref:Crh-like protein n=1 Tax=Coniochaeta ligniaria NRRL 30616 TaxID=1408157 RepID=A0A1J7IBM9_9PEZI|nr:extracellular cell wall glucanase [Coniochaeta ligniaria NRRL 30616]